jgi:hypothetical protein
MRENIILTYVCNFVQIYKEIKREAQENEIEGVWRNLIFHFFVKSEYCEEDSYTLWGRLGIGTMCYCDLKEKNNDVRWKKEEDI